MLTRTDSGTRLPLTCWRAAQTRTTWQRCPGIPSKRWKSTTRHLSESLASGSAQSWNPRADWKAAMSALSGGASVLLSHLCHNRSPLFSDLTENKEENREQACKPNSVSRGGGTAIIHLAPALLAGSSDLPGSCNGAGSPSSPIWSCSVWGLPCPRYHYRSGALLL